MQNNAESVCSGIQRKWFQIRTNPASSFNASKDGWRALIKRQSDGAGQKCAKAGRRPWYGGRHWIGTTLGSASLSLEISDAADGKTMATVPSRRSGLDEN
jgi:hypothetical protein